MREKGTYYTFQSKFFKRNILLFVVLFFILTFQFQEVNSSLNSDGLLLISEDSSSKINWLEPEVIHGENPPNTSGRTVYFHPQIACDRKNNLHVVWTQALHYNNNYGQQSNIEQLCYRFFNIKKEVWSEVQLLVNDTYYPSRPKIFIDGNDTIHFAWLNNKDIMYKNYNGESWSDEIMAVEKRNDSTASYEFVVSENGRAYFVWNELWNSTNYELFIRYYELDNKTLSSVSQITNSKYFSKIDSLALNSKLELHMTWLDKNITDEKVEVFYQVLDENLNQVVPMEIVSVIDDQRSEDSRLVIDSKDTVHIVWIESEPLNITYRSKINGKWLPIDDLTVNASAFTPDIYCDINDNIHIAWIEAGSNYVCFYYTRLTKSNLWLNTEKLPYLEGCLYPYLAADGRGNVHVVFANFISGVYNRGLIHLFGKKAPILEIHGLTIISAIVPGSLFIIVIINIVIIKQKRKRI